MKQEETLGARLGRLMAERELNYDALGKLLDMKPQTLNRYVLGQREPKAAAAAEMALRLGVDPMWLQGYDVPREAPEAGAEIPVLTGAQAAQGLPEDARHIAADVPRPEACFFLLVEERSMENAGILPGDLVLIRRGAPVREGQIAACRPDGGAVVLRRYSRQGDFTLLQPEGAGYQVTILPPGGGGENVIVGAAEKLIRDL